MRGRSSQEGDYLTRRMFLEIAMLGSTLVFLDGCSGSLGRSPGKDKISVSNPGEGGTIQSLRTSTIPAGLGINIHLVEPQQRDIERIATARFAFVRLDFPWADIEHRKGVYDFSGYEALVRAFARRGSHSLVILAYGNPLYDKSSAPFHVGPNTNEVRQAFARFAAAAAAKFKGQKIIWEIWNEPNNPDFWQPGPNADAYVGLVKVAIKAMRQADAHATIIAPAVATFPQQFPGAWKFLERCFVLGLLELIDAVSIHPYRSQPPETAASDYQRLRALIARYASPGKNNIPIVSSEWGYPVLEKFPQAYQAAFFVREFLTNIINGVPLSIWYDWHDDGPDPQNLQDNFGIVTWDNQPKLAYLAVQTLTKQLRGFHFTERLSLPSASDFAIIFARGTMKKLVLWTIDSTHTITLSIKAPVVTFVSNTGESRALTTRNGALTIELTGNPQYLQPYST